MRRLPIPVALVLTLSACGSDFPAPCNEEHQAVSLARSLTADQLTFLHAEMFRLRDQAGDFDSDFELTPDNMPENLEFLDAVKVRPNNLYHPNIMLADCFTSFVFLNFYQSGLYGNRIELVWVDDDGASQRQVLWRGPGAAGAGDVGQ